MYRRGGGVRGGAGWGASGTAGHKTPVAACSPLLPALRSCRVRFSSPADGTGRNVHFIRRRHTPEWTSRRRGKVGTAGRALPPHGRAGERWEEGGAGHRGLRDV